MVLTEEGCVWTKGWNKNGQLGDETTNDEVHFAQVISGGAKAVSPGDIHGVVTHKDGSVWATGSNTYGQVGDGSKVDTFFLSKSWMLMQ